MTFKTLATATSVTALAIGLTASCDSPSEPAEAPPDTIPAVVSVAAGNGQTAEAGEAVATAPAVTVTNAAGEPLSGVGITFVVAAGGGSVTDASATTDAEGVATLGSWTLGDEPGTNALLAGVNEGLTATFTATGTEPPPPPAGDPTLLKTVEGDDQTGLLATDLPVNPRVRVLDENGRPNPGVVVTFTPQAGSGTAGAATVTTDANGEASTTWAPGQIGTNLMDVAVEGTALTKTFFSIGGDSDFKLEIVFLTNATSITQKSAFGAAAGRWMQVITDDLTDVVFIGQEENACGVGDPATEGLKDDLLIYASLVPIDGIGGVLGAAGPCFVRGPGASDSPLTVVGVMQFDVADLGLMERTGTLDDVILHEMGHVLGIGTLWSVMPLDLLENPSFPGNEGADTHFTGANALAAFAALPGGPWNPPGTATSPVPVENTEGTGGTRDGHWRESTFETELMTGFIGGGSNPLSKVTIQSLLDMGYAVDSSQADPYVLGNPNAAPGATASFHLVNDLLRIPIKLIEPNGRVVKVIEQ